MDRGLRDGWSGMDGFRGGGGPSMKGWVEGGDGSRGEG